MDTKKRNERNSAIELLRILSMIMIVFHHFACHGGFEWGTTISITRLWYNFIVMGGKIGVNIFVLISGYYLVSNESEIFDINKVIKFVGQILFYSVGIFVACKLTGIAHYDVKALIKVFFPITFSQWWFASTYFVLYLLHPYLNKLLKNLEKSLYQSLLLLMVVCWSIIPTFTTSSFQSNPLLWFVTLYSIAGYIRLYGVNGRFTSKQYFLFYVICSILTYSSSVILLRSKRSLFSGYSTYFYEQEKLTILLISLCLFLCFLTLKMNYHKWINTLASATFGVYLLHDNSVIRKLLWIDLFNNAKYQESLFLIPYSIIVVIIVYVIFSLIDLLRQKVIEIPCMKFVKKYSNIIITFMGKRVNLLKVFIFGK